MSNKVILSTGVLAVEPDTISAVINIVNLNKSGFEGVEVEVWDWSSYDNPVKLTVYYYDNVPVPFPYSLGAQNLAVFYSDLNAANVTLYEIRIIYSGDPNVIFNCFGRSVPPYTSQEGNTVLQGSLIKLEESAPIVPVPPPPPLPPLAPCGGSVWRSTDNCLR